jgi:hypothetical protein
MIDPHHPPFVSVDDPDRLVGSFYVLDPTLVPNAENVLKSIVATGFLSRDAATEWAEQHDGDRAGALVFHVNQFSEY